MRSQGMEEENSNQMFEKENLNQLIDVDRPNTDSKRRKEFLLVVTLGCCIQSKAPKPTNLSIQEGGSVQLEIIDGADKSTVADVEEDSDIQCQNLTQNNVFKIDHSYANKTFLLNEDRVLSMNEDDTSFVGNLEIIPTVKSLKSKISDKMLYSKLNNKMTSDPKSNYTCEFCGQSFAISRSLKRHLRSHTGIKLHKCDDCGRQFDKASNFKRHLLTHKGDKLFKCDMCSRAFTRSSDLKRHLFVHAVVKPFPCSMCDKGFAQANSLKRHLMTHSGVKPYYCDLCDKVFNQKSHLQTHLKVHANEQIYKCEEDAKKLSSSLATC